MLFSFKSPTGVVTSLLVALFYAVVVESAAHQFCPKKDVCITVGYPATTVSKGSGNIYVQIFASTAYQWVAFGTGSGMSGSNMFVAYQDGAGNMTLSPRRGSGHFTPNLDTSSSAAQLQLLAGSGVSSDGNMVANFVCPNCVTWSSGSLSLSGPDDWIGAWKSGSSLSTTSESAGITQHDSTVQFTVDATQATISSDSNPFVNETNGGISTPGGGAAPGDGGNSNGNAGKVQTGGENDAMLRAHGAMMLVAFAILFPLGAMAMPLFGSVAMHAGFQCFNLLLSLVGLALGVTVAYREDKLFNNPHTVMGLVTMLALVLLQPVFGYMHHKFYQRNHHRGLISHLHIWWGRFWLVFAVITGGVGIKMTANRHGLAIPFAVLAAVMFGAWLGVKGFRHFKKGSGNRNGNVNGNGNGNWNGNGHWATSSSSSGHELTNKPN